MDLAAIATEDPYAEYRLLEDGQPVQWDEHMQAWIVTSYRECSQVARSEAVFETPWPHATSGREVLGRYGLYILRGSQHQRVHGALHKWFQTYSDDRVRSMVRRHFDEAVAGVADGRLEFFADVADPVPGRVILEVLGLPVTEQLRLEMVTLNDKLHRWFATFGDDPVALDECLTAVAAAEDLMLPTISARATEPRDDLLSALWAIGRENFADWAAGDVARYATFFFGAGTVNSANLVASVIYHLIADPVLRSRLIATPELIDPTIEELLRLWSPVQLRTRRAAVDTELGGVKIAAGQRVHPLLAAANRDGRHFDHPDDIDVGRAALKTHLGFYLGARYCAGAPLARLEVGEIVASFLRHFPDVRLDDERAAPSFTGFSYRTFRPLHLVVPVGRAGADV